MYSSCLFRRINHHKAANKRALRSIISRVLKRGSSRISVLFSFNTGEPAIFIALGCKVVRFTVWNKIKNCNIDYHILFQIILLVLIVVVFISGHSNRWHSIFWNFFIIIYIKNYNQKSFRNDWQDFSPRFFINFNIRWNIEFYRYITIKMKYLNISDI